MAFGVVASNGKDDSQIVACIATDMRNGAKDI